MTTNLFLKNYMPENIKTYQPETLELWISNKVYSLSKIKQWPLEEPSLKYLVENSIPDENYGKNKIILKGNYAQRVFEVFEYTLKDEEFSDGENNVTLYPNPLFPYSLSNPNATTPKPFRMQCTPSDGQIIWAP